MALREILANFGFNYDKGTLSQVDRSVENTKSGIGGLAASIGGLFALHKLKEFFNEIADEAAQLGKTAQQTGNSIDQVEFALFALPVPAEAAETALRKFTVAMGKSEDGASQQNAVFKKLGISLTDAAGEQRSSVDVLEDVVTNWDKLPSAGAKAATAVDLFGRAGVQLVPFLNKGKEGLAALHEEFESLGGGFGQEAVENALKYKKGLKNLNLALDSLKGSVAGPIFQWLADGYKTLAKGVGWFKKFTENTRLAKAAVTALGIAGAVGIAMLLAPFAPVIAAIGVLSLLLDDMMVFLEGGDSAFGRFLNAAFGEGTEKTVRDWTLHVGDMVQKFFADLINEPKKFVDEFKKLFKIFTIGEKPGEWLPVPEDQKPGNKVGPDGKPQKESTAGRDWVRDNLGNGIGDFLFGKNNAGSKKDFAPDVTGGPGFDQLAKMFGLDGTGTAPLPTTAVLPGQPGQQVSNEVKQDIKINQTITGGTPEEITAGVTQGTQNAIGNERRSALTALENRAPAAP